MAHEISRRGVLLAGLATGAMAATGGHPPAAAMATSTARGASRPLALAGVTVVDVAGSRLRPDTTVLVRGERIITVGRRDEVGIPHGAAVVELPGKYVIPGLWDMHTHSFGSERISPALYVAAGVTSVREMAGTPLIHQWRDRIQSGRLLGPRWTIASTTLLWDGLPAHRSHAMRAWLRRQRSWLVVEPLPGYAPELNPVEPLWASLKGGGAGQPGRRHPRGGHRRGRAWRPPHPPYPPPGLLVPALLRPVRLVSNDHVIGRASFFAAAPSPPHPPERSHGITLRRDHVTAMPSWGSSSDL
jgi:DDE superfamily endonuclease